MSDDIFFIFAASSSSFNPQGIHSLPGLFLLRFLYTQEKNHEPFSFREKRDILSPGVSELSVLKSAAGYYVGRTLDGMPYSRESGYFNTEKKAEEALAYVRNVTIPDECPEDEM